MDGSVVFARLRQFALPSIARGSMGPPESTTQTPSRSVQPFCTARGRESLYMYFSMGRPFSPQNCPFAWGSGPPYNNVVPWAHQTPHPKRHIDRFSRFCRAHDSNRQTDRPFIYVVLRCGVIIIITIGIVRVQAYTRWHFSVALCCHSNVTRAPIANSPNSAQLGSSRTTPKLHPGSYSSVGMRPRTYTQTNRQTRMTTIHLVSSIRLTRNVIII